MCVIDKERKNERVYICEKERLKDEGRKGVRKSNTFVEETERRIHVSVYVWLSIFEHAYICVCVRVC